MHEDHIHRILIVEDDALLGLLLEGFVEELGYRVNGPYLNLKDGLVHATKDDIDFALLDFDLGQGTTALPIAQVLTRRGISFVFTTATPPEHIRRFLPTATILRKPVSPAALAQLLS